VVGGFGVGNVGRHRAERGHHRVEAALAGLGHSGIVARGVAVRGAGGELGQGRFVGGRADRVADLEHRAGTGGECFADRRGGGRGGRGARGGRHRGGGHRDGFGGGCRRGGGGGRRDPRRRRAQGLVHKRLVVVGGRDHLHPFRTRAVGEDHRIRALFVADHPQRGAHVAGNESLDSHQLPLTTPACDVLVASCTAVAVPRCVQPIAPTRRNRLSSGTSV